MIKPGMLISDRYEIIEKVGSGGMADVYKAKCHRLNRMDAIKILKQEYSNDAKFVAKFRAEAQSVAGLSHQNIVNVYDVGEDDGLYYIVMELVEGITLKNFIERKGKLSVKESIGIAIQIAQGMQAAHDNHIIHRDIKPQNIIISKEGKVKVTDFGIAKAATSNTITSNAMGSVHYISPEQARGGYSDEKSDIYSLGVTLYEMLSGHVPFTGDSTVTVALAHIQDEAPSLSESDPTIPLSLDKIVKKCMQKKPDNRYMTAEALICDLKRALMQPGGEFVVIPGTVPEGPTIQMTEEELNQIKESAKAVPPAEEESVMPEIQMEEEVPENPEEKESEEEKEDIDPKLERLLLIGSGIVAIILVTAIVIGAVYLLGGCSRNNSDKPKASPKASATASPEGGENAKMVKMINVVGKDKEDAESELLALNLKVSVKYEESDAKEGEVIKQDPKEGTEIKENSTVTITISQSDKKITLEDYTGQSKESVVEALEAAGLKTSISEEYSDSQDEGKVIRTEPGAGSEVAKDDTVTVVVSKGKENTNVEVPNVRGYSEDEAISAIEAAGLTAGKVTYKYSDSPAGEVIAQSQEGGKEVAKGTTVRITVSKGPKPTAEPTAAPNYKYVANVRISMNPFDSEDEEAVIDFVLEQDGNRSTVESKNMKYSDFPYTLPVEGTSESNGTLTVYKNGVQVGSSYNVEFKKVRK